LKGVLAVSKVFDVLVELPHPVVDLHSTLVAARVTRLYQVNFMLLKEFTWLEVPREVPQGPGGLRGLGSPTTPLV
jgi:hypothetical protein